MLRVPSYEELSKEQDEVYNLPLDGNYLVIGPPGTGKTVMAMHRAARFSRAKRSNLFLTCGRPLAQYLDQAVGLTGSGGVAYTLHSWLPQWYGNYFHRKPPMKSKWEFDFLQVLLDIEKAEKEGRYFGRFNHIVVDEGQDFAKELYLVLRRIADHTTVFADENQRLYEDNSTVRDIQTYLG